VSPNRRKFGEEEITLELELIHTCYRYEKAIERVDSQDLQVALIATREFLPVSLLFGKPIEL
jgi:hypothetical protein